MNPNTYADYLDKKSQGRATIVLEDGTYTLKYESFDPDSGMLVVSQTLPILPDNLDAQIQGAQGLLDALKAIKSDLPVNA